MIVMFDVYGIRAKMKIVLNIIYMTHSVVPSCLIHREASGYWLLFNSLVNTFWWLGTFTISKYLSGSNRGSAAL